MNEQHPTGRDTSVPSVDGITMASFTAACAADPALRDKVVSDPAGALAERGLELHEGVDVKVVINDDDIFHLVLPPDPNSVLEDEALGSVAGGFNTLACAGTASSFGTVPSCVSTGGSASTLSCS